MDLNGTIWEITDDSSPYKETGFIIFYASEVYFKNEVKSYRNISDSIRIDFKENCFYDLQIDNTLLWGYFVNIESKYKRPFKAKLVRNIINRLISNVAYIVYHQNDYTNAHSEFEKFLKIERLYIDKLPEVTNDRNLPIELLDDKDLIEKDIVRYALMPLYIKCNRFMINSANKYYENEEYYKALGIYDNINHTNFFKHLEVIYKNKFPSKQLFFDNSNYNILDNIYVEAMRKLVHNYKIRITDNKNMFELLSDNEKSILQLKQYNLSDFYKFGKYKRERVDSILLNDIDYIFWCIENVLSFALAPEILLNKSIRNHKRYYSILEINLIKLYFTGRIEHDGYIFEYASECGWEHLNKISIYNNINPKS